jgi:hypothetical protein
MTYGGIDMERKERKIVERPWGEGELKKVNETEIIARVSYSMEVSKLVLIRDDYDGHREDDVGGIQINGKIKFIEKPQKTIEPTEDYTLWLADGRKIDIKIDIYILPDNFPSKDYKFILRDGNGFKMKS